LLQILEDTGKAFFEGALKHLPVWVVIPVLVGGVIWWFTGRGFVKRTVLNRAHGARGRRAFMFSLIYAATFAVGGTASVIGLFVADRFRSEPLLRLDSSLEPDREHKVLRLAVWNDGYGKAAPTAIVKWLKGGIQEHDSIMPLALGWMHDEQPQLSHGEHWKVDVVYVDLTRDILIFGNNRHYFRHVTIHTRTGEFIPVLFCIRVSIPGEEIFQERTFKLVPDSSRPFGMRAQEIDPVAR